MFTSCNNSTPGFEPAVWKDHGSRHRRAPPPASWPRRRGAGDWEGLQQVRTVGSGFREDTQMHLNKQECTHKNWDNLISCMRGSASQAYSAHTLQFDQSRQHTQTHVCTGQLPECILGMSRHSNGATWYSHMPAMELVYFHSASLLSQAFAPALHSGRSCLTLSSLFGTTNDLVVAILGIISKKSSMATSCRNRDGWIYCRHGIQEKIM